MKNITSFIKTTLIGGLFFVIPLVLLALIIVKVLDVFRKLVAPIADKIPIEAIGGITISRIIALLILLLVCFIAGLFANTKKIKELRKWIETNILSHIPGYTLLKGMTESAAGIESDDLKDVVLVNIEEVWQIGFLMDKIDDELCSVYIPGAPNPMSGDVFFVKNERLKILDLPELSAMKIYKKLGLDAKKILNGQVNQSSF
ncbi:DUF502 domain-containing protein [uncultured Eudoraea sp.]|uniref:DUF502 domain-containing protein n=1 Tax=uncultured Eudoraea sp. TaxID=1035614 RepID=UPI00261C00E1|nr:DUF502 domain-containing protein [uncultured Eudoraea sp.]